MGVCTYLQPMRGDEPAGAEVDIDKSWFELVEGLNALGLDGDFIVIGNRGYGDEDGDPDDDFYEVRLDPDEIRNSWNRLRDLTFERYYAAYRETPTGKSDTDPGTEDYLKAHFATLVDVYRTAADAGAGMRVTAW